MNGTSPDIDEKPRRSFAPQEILLLLSGTMFLCWLLANGLVYLSFQSQGLNFDGGFSFFNRDSPPEMRNFVRAALLVNHLLTFLVPALIVGWLFYRNRWQHEVGTRPAPALGVLALGILFTVAAFPLAQVVFQANSWLAEQVGFLAPLIELENSTMGMLEGMLVMDSPWEMLFSVLVMAALPAVGEELVFRGFVQRLIGQWTGRPYVAILITSLLFGLVHFQVQRLLAIVLLGIVLGLLFYWTRSLWISIFAHFLFNGIQVVVAFFNQDKLAEMAASEGEPIPIAITLLSLVALFFLAKKLNEVHVKSEPPTG